LLLPAGHQLDSQAGGAAYSAAAAPLAKRLQGDCEAAAARIQDACRSLLQVVWLTSAQRSTLDLLH
jgi:hypothetical protein